jgi:hypothetical protein
MLPPHCHEGFHADAAQGLVKTECRSVATSGQIFTGNNENTHRCVDILQTCLSNSEAEVKHGLY